MKCGISKLKEGIVYYFKLESLENFKCTVIFIDKENFKIYVDKKYNEDNIFEICEISINEILVIEKLQELAIRKQYTFSLVDDDGDCIYDDYCDEQQDYWENIIENIEINTIKRKRIYTFWINDECIKGKVNGITNNKETDEKFIDLDLYYDKSDEYYLCSINIERINKYRLEPEVGKHKELKLKDMLTAKIRRIR